MVKSLFRTPKYANVFQRKNGQWASYYRRGGRNTPIDGEPGTAAWMANYEEIHSSWEQNGYVGVGPDAFSQVSELYLRSDRYRALKPRQQAAYRRDVDSLRQLFANIPVGKIDRRKAVLLRDRIAKESPRKAQKVVMVLKLIMECAMDHGFIERNPCDGVKRPVGYKANPWRPWEDTEIELFLAHAKPCWRRAVMILLYTGLRRADAISLTWNHINDGILRYRTSKTNAEVVVPLHSRLIAELEHRLADSMFLINGERGRPIRVESTLSHAVRDEGKRLGMDDPPPLHGLRKNAVMALVEAGCEPREIQAITGQSLQTIEHYAAKYKRERLAQAAILKLEKRN